MNRRKTVSQSALIVGAAVVAALAATGCSAPIDKAILDGRSVVCLKPDGKYYGLPEGSACVAPAAEAKSRPDGGFLNAQAGRVINYDTARKQGNEKTAAEKASFTFLSERISGNDPKKSLASAVKSISKYFDNNTLKAAEWLVSSGLSNKLVSLSDSEITKLTGKPIKGSKERRRRAEERQRREKEDRDRKLLTARAKADRMVQETIQSYKETMSFGGVTTEQIKQEIDSYLSDDLGLASEIGGIRLPPEVISDYRRQMYSAFGIQ